MTSWGQKSQLKRILFLSSDKKKMKQDWKRLKKHGERK